uniref:Uncharacterized protein n=1 Tax=Arundo donax TaxID=35708 RepID=A0A0A8XXK8_ARUDO
MNRFGLRQFIIADLKARESYIHVSNL